MTVLEVIQRSTAYLAKRGVESPRLQVELLLAYLLRTPRLRLYLNFDRVLDAVELEALRGLVVRRGNREPLQHLVESVSFCGLELAVTRDVLIPRPETEGLAELGWRFLNGLVESRESPPVCLDFGTGSGCLAITIATQCLRAEIHALEVSSAALAVARANATRNGVQARIVFHEGNSLRVLPPGLRLDLVVANPPYIPTALIDQLEPEVRLFDPRLALDGGPDGLSYYRQLAREIPAFLQNPVRLMLEFGDGQADALMALFAGPDWQAHTVHPDLTGKPRILELIWTGSQGSQGIEVI